MCKTKLLKGKYVCNHFYKIIWSFLIIMGKRKRSGSVVECFDSRPRGCGFEPHRRHCVVSLSKNINRSLVLVQPKKTHPFITERLLKGRKDPNQTNKIMVKFHISQP